MSHLAKLDEFFRGLKEIRQPRACAGFSKTATQDRITADCSASGGLAMRIRLLGTAAGGGFPQWNCNCEVCREARLVIGRALPRTQCSVAVSADGDRWFLLNASPDLRAQIENFAPLQPRGTASRHTPIESVLLTNADLDHTLGLFLLREGGPLTVHATKAVQRALAEGLSLDRVLANYCGTKWVEPPSVLSPLLLGDGSPSGLCYEAIPVSGKPPRFAANSGPDHKLFGVAYRIVDERTAGAMLLAPGIAAIDQLFLAAATNVDLLLFDGTFWSDEEMIHAGAGTSLGTNMGHLPIAGPEGSLHRLTALKARRKVYIHINNTNPILIEDSAEACAVRRAGVEIGVDGMEFVV
jgi:pyrroloquinoline quinone biosynthesis protein B